MAKKSKNIVNLVNNDKNKKPENDVNTMAKKKVNELLDDVELLSPKSDDNLFEIDENVDKNSLEWLQEQIDKLSVENEKLKKEASEAKENYRKIHAQYQHVVKNGVIDETKDVEANIIPDSMLKNGIFNLFNEVQNNYLGINPQKHKYTDVKLIHLLHKMIKLFPFLNDHKKF